MPSPKDVLAQLLSPAQAETLDVAGSVSWRAAAAAFEGFLGKLPGVGEVDGRLVMPDEIIADYADPHLVLPITLATNRDESATAYAVASTLIAAMFFDSTADDGAEQETQTSLMAATVLGQVVAALNAKVFAGSPTALTISAGEITANSMPDTLGAMDEPALALAATLQGDRLLPFSLVLPGTFLDVVAGALPPDIAARTSSPAPASASAPAANAIDASLGFTLSADDLDDAELVDEYPQPAAHRPFAMAGAAAGGASPFGMSAGAGPDGPERRSPHGREPLPISQAPAAHRARFAPLPDPAPSGISRSAMDLLAGLKMNVVVELGRTELTVSEVLGLGPGSVVELDRLAGEPVDILVNDRLIARGEVVVVDENFGVRVVEVVRRSADTEERAG